jgi:carboxymethylenebutenolidase
MSGELIDVETQDGVADAYLASQDDQGRHPGVLFLVDAFGLRPQIERIAYAEWLHSLAGGCSPS